YGIPANGCEKFKNAMKKIVPEYCTNKPLWLSSDTAMVPPELLVKHGASLSRTIQSSGQFVVIFPESFTSTICCGYCVSESVYFAPTTWLDLAVKAFQDIKKQLQQELQLRAQLNELGLKQFERNSLIEARDKRKNSKVLKKKLSKNVTFVTCCVMFQWLYILKKIVYIVFHMLLNIFLRKILSPANLNTLTMRAI
ncbi:protein Jumonji, partial [Caerostris extrusa]